MAFVLDQVSVAVLPAAVLVGLTAMVTVGGGVCPVETLKGTAALDAVSVLVPAKLALRVLLPNCEGVSVHAALPPLSVVALHDAPPNDNVTDWPGSITAGVADTSDSEATRFTA